ncbi:MAG: alpha/beta hydrolase [Novosphingobium sp.]
MMIWLAVPLALLMLAAAWPMVPGRIRAPKLVFPLFSISLTGQIFSFPLAILAAVLAWIASGVAAWVFAGTAATALFVHLRNRIAGRVMLDAVGLTETRIPLLAGLTPFLIGGPKVRRIKALAYGPHGARNTLDVVLPTQPPATPMPILIHIHGGGWIQGDRGQQGRPLLHYLAARGWMGVDVTYRLGPAERMPAMIVDVLRAIAWVRQHAAEYGGDPARIALTGGSAGGQLTALAALAHDDPALKPGFEDADCSVAMAVPVYGIYDLFDRNRHLRRNHEGILDDFLGERVFPGWRSTHAALWRALSPIERVRPDAPPMLVIHGTGDVLLPYGQSREFVEALRRVSRAPATLIELPGIEHAYDMAATATVWAHVRAIEAFLAPLAAEAGGERP